MRKIIRQRGTGPRATSCRNTGRHHVGTPGDIISECPGDFIGIRTKLARHHCVHLILPKWVITPDALEFAGDAPSPTVFAGVIVEDLGRNLAGGQHPTHLCHHATRFLHTKAGTYELFRTNFGCPGEDGSLAASRSVSRCCSKGFAVSSIRDSGTAKTARPILQACRNTLSPSWARCSFRRSPGRLSGKFCIVLLNIQCEEVPMK